MQNEKTQYLTLAEVTRLCPSDISPNTCWRWCRRGVRGRNGAQVKLRHVRIGGKIFVPSEAVHEFFEATAEADSAYFDGPNSPKPTPPKQRPASARERAIDAAERALESAGC